MNTRDTPFIHMQLHEKPFEAIAKCRKTQEVRPQHPLSFTMQNLNFTSYKFTNVSSLEYTGILDLWIAKHRLAGTGVFLNVWLSVSILGKSAVYKPFH